MKRFVWILLAAFCTLLAQVQPVDLAVTKHEEGCTCCENKGACGMPDCTPAPRTAPADRTLQAVRSASSELRQQAQVPAAKRVPFYFVFVPSPAVMPELGASLAGAPVASVPLFKAQCRFLI